MRNTVSRPNLLYDQLYFDNNKKEICVIDFKIYAHKFCTWLKKKIQSDSLNIFVDVLWYTDLQKLHDWHVDCTCNNDNFLSCHSCLWSS